MTSPLTASLEATAPGAASQRAVAAIALALLAGLVALAAKEGATWRVPALALVGGGIGFVLLKADFGFAGSFRAALERGDFTGFRAQALALAACTAIFFPLLGLSDALGLSLDGFASDIGVAFAIGAVMFGLGMQIGGGCASGTLYALGGGNGALAVTLAFFIAGSALGAAQLHWWAWLPALPATTTQDLVGWPIAMALHLALFAALFRHLPGQTRAAAPAWPRGGALLTRPWPLMLGALGLAALNTATLLLSRRPWGETWGFTIWGSKIAAVFGIDAARWPYWQGQEATLSSSVFADVTSVMDFGIVIGAALAAGLGGSFAPRIDARVRPLLGAALGGLLMGYGARLSGGCNIGAYFSALASGSLSGWAWVAFAVVGSALGLRLRPLFGRG